MSDSIEKSNRSSDDISSYMWHGPCSAVYRMRAKKGFQPNDGKGHGEAAEIATVIGKLLFRTVAGLSACYANSEEKNWVEEAEELRRQIQYDYRGRVRRD